MGLQFFWFYDILIVAIFLAVVYRCTRAGFASVLVSFAGIFLAFAFALMLSAPIANAVYDSAVKPGVVEKIDYSENETSMSTAFDTLRNTDMSKAVIRGQSMEEFTASLEPDESGKVHMDLTNVDLSRTGIMSGNLEFFGINDISDFNALNLGRVDISPSMYANNEVHDIILARAVSQQIANKAHANHEQLNGILDSTIPGFSRVATGSTDLISMLIIGIINSESDSLYSAIDDNLVKPVLIVPIRTLLFVIIFAIVSIVVSFVAKALRIINKIPILGRLNSLLGGVLGSVRAVVVIFMVCLGVRVLISLTSNNILILNTMTIDETYIFQYFYYLRFLNF